MFERWLLEYVLIQSTDQDSWSKVMRSEVTRKEAVSGLCQPELVPTQLNGSVKGHVQ